MKFNSEPLEVDNVRYEEPKNHDTVDVHIEICREGVEVPTYANEGDAGMDVRALDQYTIKPGETVLIPLGIKVALPEGYEFQVRPRSGQSLKTKLRVANSPGTIDSNYRDEIGVIIENIASPIKDFVHESYPHVTKNEPIVIEKGQRIAQLVISKVPTVKFQESKNVAEIGKNRKGGFGSTGEV